MADRLRLVGLVKPLLEKMGFELWGLECSITGRQGFVRVFVDAPQGVNLADCGAISERLSALFDVEDPMPVPYRLEVSSPGVDRPLFEPWQYGQYVGWLVKLRLAQPREGCRNLTGRVLAANDTQVCLSTEQGELALGYEEIARARLVFEPA